jgi:hypothetical protein
MKKSNHKKWLFLVVSICFVHIFIGNLALYSQEESSHNHRIVAHRIENNGIVLDGRLNEDGWQEADAITKLIQCEPDLGKLSTE